jgi:quercetin dioxygenase-like cupin family protein
MECKEKAFAGSIDSLESVPADGVCGVDKKIVFGPKRFWNDYVMRYFTLDEAMQTPLHAHEWPHYVVILSGKVEFVLKDQSYIVEGLSWAYVPPGETHCFKNIGDDTLSFLCTVPLEGDPEA